jgi:hypothetical protein
MRHYKLTRLRAGEYLVPSNDAQTLWRISSYEEDGSASSTDSEGREHVLRGMFWQTWKWNGTIEQAQALAERAVEEFEFLYDERWHVWSHLHATRQEALEAIFGKDDEPE